MPKVALPFIGTNFLPLSCPALGDFTWQNQTPPSASTAASATDGLTNDPQTPLVLSGEPDDATNYSLSALERPLPGAQFTVVTAQAAWGRGGIWTAPIFLRSTSSSKLVYIAWIGSMPAGVTTTINGGTDLNSLEASLFDVTNVSGPPPFSDYLLWFKVTFDGVDLKFYNSPEGTIWSEMPTTAGLASFLPSFDRVGFGILRANQADLSSGLRGPQHAIVWQWIESDSVE